MNLSLPKVRALRHGFFATLHFEVNIQYFSIFYSTNLSMQNGLKWNRDGTLQDDFYYFVERRRPGVPGGNYSLKYLSFSFEFVTFFN